MSLKNNAINGSNFTHILAKRDATTMLWLVTIVGNPQNLQRNTDFQFEAITLSGFGFDCVFLQWINKKTTTYRNLDADTC